METLSKQRISAPPVAATAKYRRLLAYAPAIVFLVALIARLAFNLFANQHITIDARDGYFYLYTGSKLLQLFSSNSLEQALALLGTHAHAMDTDFGSLAIADRLLLDGAVYPLFLSGVLKLIGVAPGATSFAAYAKSLSIAYSIVDAVTAALVAALGTAIFNKRIGILSGALYALYPPAIAATASSFTEPFATLCLLSFSCLLVRNWRKLGDEDGPSIGSWIFCGFLAGAVMLVRSAFLPIPAICLLILFCARASRQPLKMVPAILMSMVVGASIVMAPYGLFTWWQTGKPAVSVQRAPGYNISIGWDTQTDGWMTYSPQLMHLDSGGAVKAAVENVARNPIAYVDLTLRKLGRLFAGAWMDFRPVTPSGRDGFDAWHQILMLSGFAGMLWLLRTKREQQNMTWCLALVLMAVPITHLIYLFFSPISRYAFTAAPFMLILASYAWLAAAESKSLALRTSLVLSILLAVYCNLAPSMVPVLVQLGLPFRASCTIHAALLATLFIAAFVPVLKLDDTRGSRLRYAGIAGIVVAGAAVFASTASSPERSEWSVTLKPRELIKQTFHLGSIGNASSAVVLIDVISPAGAPTLSLSVNGAELPGCVVPWRQLTDNAEDHRLLDVFQLQAGGSGQSTSAFRQWWAAVVPVSYLKPNAPNDVVIKSLGGNDTIYGDYIDRKDKQRWLPSLNRASFFKGFTEYRRGDCRIYEHSESMPATSSYFKRKLWSSADLSNSAGRQCGEYRVLMRLLPSSNSATKPSFQPRPDILVCSSRQLAISGGDPTSFALPNISMRDLPTGTRIAIIDFDVAGTPGSGWFSGQLLRGGSGSRISVPDLCGEFKVTRKYRHVRFVSVLPESSADASLNLAAAPFPSDLLFLRKKQAWRRRMTIANLAIRIRAVDFPSHFTQSSNSAI